MNMRDMVAILRSPLQIVDRYGDKLKKSAWYLSVPMVNFLISTFSYPILASYLSAEDYGLVGYFGSFITFINVFFGLAFNTYFMSVYQLYDQAERQIVVRKIISALLVWNVFFLPLSVGLLALFLHLNNVSIPLVPYGILALLIAFFSFFKNFPQISYRLEGAAPRYFALMSGQKILSVGCILLFVIFWRQSALGQYTGMLIAETILLVYVVRLYFRSFKLTLDAPLIKDALRVTLPLLPASLLYIPIVSYDTIVLEKVGSLNELGLYTIGKSIGVYLYTVGFAVYQVYEPVLYRAVNDRERSVVLKIVARLTGIITLLVVGLNVVLPQLVAFLTNNRFNGAVPFARVLVISSGLTVLFSVGDTLLSALQKTKTILWIHASAAVLCFASYTYFAQHGGYIGVAWATVLVYCYLFIVGLVEGLRQLRLAPPLLSSQVRHPVS